MSRTRKSQVAAKQRSKAKTKPTVKHNGAHADEHDHPGAAYRGRVELVTPETATRWLEKNTANRRVVQSRVDSIAADIRAGKWVLTGDPIRFDINGEMIDGQHRLWAIILADQPVQTYVVRGLPIESKLVIDTGAKRTLANYFQITKEPDPNVLAAIVNIAYQYDNNRWTRSERGPTHAEGEAFLAGWPEIRDSVTVARSAQRGIGLAPSPMGAAHAINARIDPEAADEFWARVADGVGLEAGDPILAYRRFATKVLSARVDRPPTRTQFAHAMKAMLLWRQGKKVRQLTWHPVGDPIPNDWGMKR